MEGVDLQAEELGVAVAVGLAFRRLEFVVRALQRAGRDRVGVPVQQARPVQPQRLGELLEHRHVRRLGSDDPVVQVPLGCVPAGLLPELT